MLFSLRKYKYNNSFCKKKQKKMPKLIQKLRFFGFLDLKTR